MKKCALTLAEGTTHINRQHNNRKCAFTLAEVLITLGIIGVVAAMTLPILISNNNKKVAETQLKQAYSLLNQALKLSEAENGSAIYWDWSIMGNGTSVMTTPEGQSAFFDTYFKPYLKKIKYGNETTVPIYDDSGNRLWNCNRYMYTLVNGQSILFSMHNTASGIENKNYLGVFAIQTTNTPKKAIQGKNVFSFAFLNNNKNIMIEPRSYPIWTCSYMENNRETFKRMCKGYSGNSGISPSTWCTYMIYCNEWQIPKDYPVKF